MESTIFDNFGVAKGEQEVGVPCNWIVLAMSVMYKETRATIHLTCQLGITVHSTPDIYVQGLSTPRSEKSVIMNSQYTNQTHLSTIASIRSSKSKYISLFE